MLTDSIVGTAAAASWADDDVAGMTAADMTGSAQHIQQHPARKRNTENRIENG